MITVNGRGSSCSAYKQQLYSLQAPFEAPGAVNFKQTIQVAKDPRSIDPVSPVRLLTMTITECEMTYFNLDRSEKSAYSIPPLSATTCRSPITTTSHLFSIWCKNNSCVSKAEGSSDTIRSVDAAKDGGFDERLATDVN